MTPRDGRAGLALLEARLEAFRAYGDLVRAQEAAADRGDLEEIERLTTLRDEYQRRLEIGGDLAPESRPAEPDITGGPADVRPVPAEAEPGGAPQLTVSDGGVTERERAARRMEQIQTETRRVLLDTAEAHQRFVQRLERLRDETRADVEGMGRRRSGIASYVGRKADGPGGVNIRF